MPLVAVSQKIPLKNYTNIEGLPSRNILDIAQDRQGYLWFATEVGLVKFDGYNFKAFKASDGLCDNFITAIYPDSENRLWVGGYNGKLSVLEHNAIKSIEFSGNGEPGEIISIFQDKKKKIWCFTSNGLSVVRNDSLYHFYTDDSEENDMLLCHYLDNKNRLWFFINNLYVLDTVVKKITWPEIWKRNIHGIVEEQPGKFWFASQESGLICKENDEIFTISTKDGMPTNIVISILRDSSGNIWAGTYYGGIIRIKDNKVEHVFLDGIEEAEIHDLYQDSYGRIWAKTLVNGVFIIDDDKVFHLTKENGLVDNTVTKIFEDDNRNIWICTENGGISKYGKVLFNIYDEGLIGDEISVHTLVYHSSGKIYTGSYEGLTSINLDGSYNHFGHEEGLPEAPYIISLVEGDNGDLWLGTLSGVTRFNKKQFTYYYDTLFVTDYYDIWSNSMAYRNDTLYCATEKGLIIFDGSNYSLLDETDGLINNDLFSVSIDSEANVWCGSSEGLSIWDGNQFYNYTTFNGLPDNFCNDISFDSRGVAWIATDNGVSSVVLNEDFEISTRNYTMEDGLASNTIYSILSDKNGNIWLGHNNGVDYIDLRKKETRNFGFREGFLPLETKLGAIALDNNDNIWFGTVDGVVKYNPKYDTQLLNPPKVYINNISLFNDTTSLERYYTQKDSITGLPKDLKLHHARRNIMFHFVGLHYTIVEKNQYKYRLLGYEEAWSEPTHDIKTIPYRKLPHGKYTFQVISSNCDGIWTNEPAEYTFEILPPWWKTWWARTVQGIIIVLLIYLFTYLRERKLRHDRNVLRQKVKERTVEIEMQKEKIEDQKRQITDSIEYAQHIQSAILPKENTLSPILNDYFILYKPRDIVSGDFYWIDGNKDRVVAVAADCTGHGVPGAFLSMLGVAILNQINAANKKYKSGEILDSLRKQLIYTLSHTRAGEKSRDGMDLALSIIDFKNKKVQFSGAINPLILVRKKEMEIFKGDKMPVGLHIGETKPFSTREIEIHKGDNLYMFSDGYADQFGGPDDKKFMVGNFRKLLCDISDKPMNDQYEILNRTIEEWKEGYEQIDDILVMGIKI
jgi:ligand-binding sensor domain-containing protein/serine phosphatase RsbU (regulator of sigma subunit)